MGRNHLAEVRAHNRDPTSRTLAGSGGRECQNELPRGVAPSRARAQVARGAKAASVARRVSLPPRSRSLAEDEPPQSTAASPRHPLASAGGRGARRTTKVGRGCTAARGSGRYLAGGVEVHRNARRTEDCPCGALAVAQTHFALPGASRCVDPSSARATLDYQSSSDAPRAHGKEPRVPRIVLSFAE